MANWVITGHSMGGVVRGAGVMTSILGDNAMGHRNPIQSAAIKVAPPMIKKYRAAAQAVGSHRMEFQSATVPAGMRVVTYAEQFTSPANADVIRQALLSGDEGRALSLRWKIKEAYAILPNQSINNFRIIEVDSGARVNYTGRISTPSATACELRDLLDFAGEQHVSLVHLVITAGQQQTEG